MVVAAHAAAVSFPPRRAIPPPRDQMYGSLGKSAPKFVSTTVLTSENSGATWDGEIRVPGAPTVRDTKPEASTRDEGGAGARGANIAVAAGARLAAGTTDALGGMSRMQRDLLKREAEYGTTKAGGGDGAGAGAGGAGGNLGLWQQLQANKEAKDEAW